MELGCMDQLQEIVPLKLKVRTSQATLSLLGLCLDYNPWRGQVPLGNSV